MSKILGSPSWLHRPTSIPFAQLKDPPPLIVRIFTVGTAIGVATPLYALAAVFVGFWRLRQMYPALTIVLGITTAGVAVFSFNHVVPFLFMNGHLLLPLSAANGVSGGASYALAELIFGIDVLAASAFTGPALGASTAIIAPFLLPVAAQICWGVGPSDLGFDLTQVQGMEWISSNFLWFV